MPTDKEVLHGLLSSTVKMDEAGVTSLYNEDGTELNDNALEVIISKFAEHIATLKPDVEKIKTDQYKRGQSESLANYEKRIAATFDFKTDKKGDDFLTALKEHLTATNEGDPEKIKKSRIYLDEMEKFTNEKAEVENKWKGEFDSYKKQVEREKLFKVITDDALVQFEGLGPILPLDPQKAANQKKWFIADLAAVDYDIRDGKKVLLKPDGSDLLDNLGHRVPFETFVAETAAKYFEFKKSEDKAAPPHNNRNPKSTVFIINSEADFTRLMNEVKTVEEKTAVLNAFNEAKAAGRIK